MVKIIESRDLPEEDEVWMVKGKSGWRIVYPTKHPITGKRNWANTLYGGRKNLNTLIIYVLLALIISYGVSELIESYKDVAENPCRYCRLSTNYDPIVDNLRLSKGINFSFSEGDG